MERQYAGLEGRRVLVAEDQVIVALDLAENLRGWGCTVLGPVASTTEGLELLRHERPDAALLDAKLADGWVTPLAEALAAAGVPFALLTGCDGPALDDPALRAAPHLPKPYTPAALRRRLLVSIAAPAHSLAAAAVAPDAR